MLFVKDLIRGNGHSLRLAIAVIANDLEHTARGSFYRIIYQYEKNAYMHTFMSCCSSIAGASDTSISINPWEVTD